MNKELITYLHGKVVRVFLKNNFRYEGTLKSYDDVHIVIDDLRTGIVILSLDTINTLEEVKQ